MSAAGYLRFDRQGVDDENGGHHARPGRDSKHPHASNAMGVNRRPNLPWRVITWWENDGGEIVDGIHRHEGRSNADAVVQDAGRRDCDSETMKIRMGHDHRHDGS